MRNIATVDREIRKYERLAQEANNARDLQAIAAHLAKLKAEKKHIMAAELAASNKRTQEVPPYTLSGGNMLENKGIVGQAGNNLISNAKSGAMVGLGGVAAENVAAIFDGVIAKMTGGRLPEFMTHPLFEIAKPFMYSLALDAFLQTEAAAAIPANTRGYLQRAVNLMQQGHSAEVTKTFVAPFAQELIGQLKDLPLPAADVRDAKVAAV
jgi:hypothetical protein